MLLLCNPETHARSTHAHTRTQTQTHKHTHTRALECLFSLSITHASPPLFCLLTFAEIGSRLVSRLVPSPSSRSLPAASSLARAALFDNEDPKATAAGAPPFLRPPQPQPQRSASLPRLHPPERAQTRPPPRQKSRPTSASSRGPQCGRAWCVPFRATRNVRPSSPPAALSPRFLPFTFPSCHDNNSPAHCAGLRGRQWRRRR